MHKMPGRSLDFPVSFQIRGTSSNVSATLLQIGLGGCRIRTWRIMPMGEVVRIDVPREDGSVLEVSGEVCSTRQLSITSYEHLIELHALTPAQEDLLAREAALLVRRRPTAAALRDAS